MLLGAGCSVLSAVCSLWNIMVGAEGADLAARAPSHCASVHQLGHVPGRTCKQGCGQGAARAVGKPQGPGLFNPLPAPSCQGWQIYSSMQQFLLPGCFSLMEPALGEGCSTWDARLQPSSLGTQAVAVPRGGCHQPGGTGSILSPVPAAALSLMTSSACLSPQLTLLCRLIKLHTLRNAAAKGCCSLTGVQCRLGNAHIHVFKYIYLPIDAHAPEHTRTC